MRCSRLQPPNPIEHLFDAPDGKRGNHQLAVARGGGFRITSTNCSPESSGCVIAVAVRRFDQDDIGGDRAGWIGKNRAVVTSEIATEQNIRTTRESDDHERRAQ